MCEQSVSRRCRPPARGTRPRARRRRASWPGSRPTRRPPSSRPAPPRCATSTGPWPPAGRRPRRRPAGCPHWTVSSPVRPTPATLKRSLTELDTKRKACDDATAAVRKARTAARAAASAAETSEAAVRAAWREFDVTRDALARFGPPPADREDLAGAWTALADRGRPTRPAPGATRATPRATAVAGADARRRGGAGRPGRALRERRGARAGRRLRPGRGGRRGTSRGGAAADRGAHRRGVQAPRRPRDARTRPPRWRGRWPPTCGPTGSSGGCSPRPSTRWWRAPRDILRELSGGQYDLVHQRGEFFVVDHHDAGLRRAVRTLSGGETFQASLALALALSEQLAGMSAGTASLESIVLDEGFGTLDAATLDTVAATLENLAARGDRMVGVVTHVRGARRADPGTVRGQSRRADGARRTDGAVKLFVEAWDPTYGAAVRAPTSRAAAARRPRVDGPAGARRRGAGRGLGADLAAARRAGTRRGPARRRRAPHRRPGVGRRRERRSCPGWPRRTPPGWCGATCGGPSPRWSPPGCTAGCSRRSPAARRHW